MICCGRTTRLATFPDYLVLHMRKFVLSAGWVPKKMGNNTRMIHINCFCWSCSFHLFVLVQRRSGHPFNLCSLACWFIVEPTMEICWSCITAWSNNQPSHSNLGWSLYVHDVHPSILFADVFVDVPDEIDINCMRSKGLQPDEQLLPETPGLCLTCCLYLLGLLVSR